MKKIIFFSLIFIFYCDPPTEVSTDLDDCAGVPNGDSTEDNCGICDADDANDDTTCSQDCAGTWGGTATVDCEGTCNGTIGPLDCAGICNGTAIQDNCGTCDSNPSNDCFVDYYLAGHRIHSEHQALEFDYCYPTCPSNPDNCNDLTTDEADTTFSLSQHLGKVVMIEMSATW